MQQLKSVLLGILVGTSAFAATADWTQLTGGKGHLCWIDAGGAKCVGGPDLSGLKDPYWLQSSDVTVCAKDADGMHCWMSGRRYELPAYSKATEVRLEGDRICGKLDDQWRCGSVSGGAPAAVDVKLHWEKQWEAHPTADGTCILGKGAYCLGPKDKQWKLVSDGFIVSRQQRQNLVVRGELECHLQEYGKRWDVGCGALRPERFKVNARTFNLLGSLFEPEQVLSLTITPLNFVCLLLRLPVSEGSNRLRNRIVCNKDSLLDGKSKNFNGAVSEGHWFSSVAGRQTPPFFDPQSIAPYGNGICARDEDKLRCWDVVASKEIEGPELKSLVPYDFGAENLASTLVRVADILYSNKAKFIRRLADHFPEDGAAHTFVLNAIHPFLDSAEPEVMASARHFYRRARAEANANLGVSKATDFAQTQAIRQAALELLVDGLRAFSDTLPAGTEALVAAAGEALATGAEGQGLEKFLEKLPEFRKLLPTLETNTRTAPLGETAHWIFDYFSRA